MKNDKFILVELRHNDEIKGVSIYTGGLIKEYYTPSSETCYTYNKKNMLIKTKYIDTYNTFNDEYQEVIDEYEYDNNGELIKIISYNNIYDDAYEVYTEEGGYEYDEYRSYKMMKLEDKFNYFNLPKIKLDGRFINDKSFINYLPKGVIEVNCNSPKFVGLKERVNEFLKEINEDENESEEN